MAKNNSTAIDAAMNLVEKVIENLGKCKSKNECKKSKNKRDFYAPSEKEFNNILEEFDELTFKKFCKSRDLNKEKKKSVKKYCEYLTTYLPVVSVYARYMSSLNNSDLNKKDKIMTQFTNETYIDYIKELVNNDDDIPDGLEYYPLIAGTMYDDIKTYNNETPSFMNDVTKIAIWASQKTITKLAKKCDCPSEVAMSIIIAIPTKDAYSGFPTQWVRRNSIIKLIDSLIESEGLEDSINEKKIPDWSEIFEYMDIPESAIIPQIFATNSDSNSSLCLSCLSDWALDTLNEMSDDDMEAVMKSYCFTASKIQNYEPRIIFSELPSEYIKLRNIATRIKNNKKFADKGFDKILK